MKENRLKYIFPFTLEVTKFQKIALYRFEKDVCNFKLHQFGKIYDYLRLNLEQKIIEANIYLYYAPSDSVKKIHDGTVVKRDVSVFTPKELKDFDLVNKSLEICNKVLPDCLKRISVTETQVIKGRESCLYSFYLNHDKEIPKNVTKGIMKEIQDYFISFGFEIR